MSGSTGLYSGPSRISRFDLYRSSPKDLTEPTSIGGMVSIIALTVMAYLITTELWAHLTPTITTSMLVTNASERFDRVRINFNVTMHALPCVVASVDHQDVMGGHTMDIHGSITKTRLSAEGAELGVYVPHEERDGAHAVHGDGEAHEAGALGAPHGHAHGHPQVTPEEAAMLAAEAVEQRGEGCRLYGSFTVKKVPGNVHISAHAHANLLSRIYGNRPMDISHSIHSFWFGDTEAGAATRNNVPEAQLDPLHGTQARLPVPPPAKKGSYPAAAYSQEYFLEVVPTKFIEPNGRVHHSHQFAAHQTSVQGRYPIPAVYFRFNFSPLTVTYAATTKPWSHFVVQLCAIVGGVFVVLGLVSSSLNTAHNVLAARKRA